MKKIILLTVFLIAATANLFAITWETASRGFWSDSSVWQNGVVPPYTNSDTFIIKHPLVIEHDLVFNAGATIYIETQGGICGHQKTTVNKYAIIQTFGILELDTLHLIGGMLNCFDGQVLLTYYAKVEGTGARLKVDSLGSMKVGVWFECVLPNYAFLLDGKVSTAEIQLPSVIQVYPNPTSGKLYIETLEPSSVNIYNNKGTLIYKSEGNVLNTELDINGYPSGIYVIKCEGSSGVLVRRVVVN